MSDALDLLLPGLLAASGVAVLLALWLLRVRHRRRQARRRAAEFLKGFAR